MNDIPSNPTCVANHCGMYMIQPTYLTTALAAIKAGTWPVSERPTAESGAGGGSDLYVMARPGVAGIRISGPMMKGWSKFPHSNTIDTRRGLSAAVRDDDVKAIVLQIDSPGGTVAGTQDLADDVRAASEAKPVYAYGDDLVTSAAYWVASQTRGITVNRTAVVGSIGTVMVVDDHSKRYEMEGVETHVVSTGARKGAGAMGAPVTKQDLALFQGTVDALNEHFLAAVSEGRGLTGSALEAVSDGGWWVGAEAQSLGLVDEIGSLGAMLDRVAGEVEASEVASRAGQMRAKVGRASVEKF